MKPSLLIPILTLLASVPSPSQPNDFVPWPNKKFNSVLSAAHLLTLCHNALLPIAGFLRWKFAVEMDSCPEPCGRWGIAERPLMCLGNIF